MHLHLPEHEAINSRKELSAVKLAVGTMVVLILIKVYAWLDTNSLSIFSSLIDSSMDILVSLINLFAVKYAYKPADDDHRFGHTAIEDIVGLVQSAFIFGSGVFILLESLSRFINPVEVVNQHVGITVMVISIIMTFGLVNYQNIVSKQTKSLIVQADMMHYLGDLLAGILIIVSLYLSRNPALDFVDPLLALAIAAYLAHGAYGIFRRSYDNLMDREIDDETKEKIAQALRAQEGTYGFHDLRTRTSGRKVFIQLHLEFEEGISLKKAHDRAEIAEKIVQAIVPNSEVLIHLDPHDDSDLDGDFEG
jgi:ferrous-iron efflux pump FieF